MYVSRTDDGDLVFSSLPDVCVDALREVPTLLASNDKRVRERLFPETYGDPEREAEWRSMVGAELEHLVSDRITLVEKDLRSVETDRTGTFSLTIDHRREKAWLSALNAARLALFILNDLDEADMACDPHEVSDRRKSAALLDMHLLAWVQELIMRVDVDFGDETPDPSEA